MNDRLDLIPAALYARVSSDRQDVDLSVAAQLRALRDYAEKNGYLVCREYIDEAESGRIADRPQFHEDAGRGQQAAVSIPGNPRLEILPLHPQAGARRRLQVHADEADAIDTGTSAGIAKLIRTWLCLSIIAFSRTN